MNQTDHSFLTTLEPIYRFFEHKRFTVFSFQEECWKVYLKGNSALLKVPTGSGKTYAAFCAPLAHLIKSPGSGIQILYITPLRALANDITQALQEPISYLNLPFRLESRTGDTSYNRRKKQKKSPPEILLTTPESLALMLSDGEMLSAFGNLKAVIVDEWHELMGTKRGVFLELLLAQLSSLSSPFQLIGMSATLGNMEECAKVLGGGHHQLHLISANVKREAILNTLLPPNFTQLPWSPLFGLRMLPYVLSVIDPTSSTLLFTNSRAQAEKWFEEILTARPEWKDFVSIHHGSIGKKQREEVEATIKQSPSHLVVCTSSLDLGVDFHRVDHVIQIGSPKSLIRLIQRAGRSNHRPFAPCHLTLVPTHVMELLELMSLRKALEESCVESRPPLTLCVDVLLQHLMSQACGTGFTYAEMMKQLRSTYAFSQLKEEDLKWALQFLEKGGSSLEAYPEFHKLECVEGRFVVSDRRLKLLHRMNIGTIPSNSSIQIKYPRGQKIGQIEESFINRLKKGETFIFGGKAYELVAVEGFNAVVKRSHDKEASAVRWIGARLPLTANIASKMRAYFDYPLAFKHYPEALFFSKAMYTQSLVSLVPKANEILVERVKTREGYHLFIYPFESRALHHSLNALLATRMLRLHKSSYTLTSNEYGCEILSPDPFDSILPFLPDLFYEEDLEADLNEGLNLSAMAKSAFRDVARIAGLVTQNFPGRHKLLRQVQMTTGLLYDVFVKYDSENLLLQQARREVIVQDLEFDRLRQLLRRIQLSKLIFHSCKKLSPLALPLFIEHPNSMLSKESLEEMIAKIQKAWITQE